ncbi:hypothetical protein B296_00047039, partial [Ensete ventricosum]
VDAVKNSLGVRRELTEGIGSLQGWCKGVHQKKTKTRWKIIGGSRKAYRDEISLKFAKRYAKGIRKLTRNTSGDRRKKTGRLVARMQEAADWREGTTFAKISMGKLSVSDKCTIAAQDFERLTRIG